MSSRSLQTKTETDIVIEKTEKYEKPRRKNTEKNENSVFADDGIYYLNYMHFRR